MTWPSGRILLVGWRNLHYASGEWQLIANRAAAIYETTRIPTDAAVLVNMKRHGLRPKVNHPEGLAVHILDASHHRIPLAYVEMKRWLLERRERTRAVIFSGLPSYPMVRIVAGWGVPIFGDLHGAYEEMAEYGRYHTAVNAKLVRLCNRWEASITPRLSARLVVSRSLGELSHRLHGDVPCIVIPCGVKASCGQSMELRRVWRERFGWKGKTIWTYCGGHSPWQRVEQVIAQFARFSDGDDALLWIITPDATHMKAKCLAKGIPSQRVRCETLLPEQIQERLPAADVGFLLRDQNVTNQVAFPNKFAQYVNAGLLTVLTKGLPEPAGLSSGYGVSIVIDSPRTSLAESPWRGILMEALRRRSNQLKSFHEACHALVDEHLTYARVVKPLIEAL